MPKIIRIVPETATDEGQTINFVLAIGSAAVSSPDNLPNFHKHRNAFERVAREKLALGEIDDGEIQLTML